MFLSVERPRPLLNFPVGVAFESILPLINSSSLSAKIKQIRLEERGRQQANKYSQQTWVLGSVL